MAQTVGDDKETLREDEADAQMSLVGHVDKSEIPDGGDFDMHEETYAAFPAAQ